MDYSEVCRTCLSTDTLNPIFMNPAFHKRYSNALYLTTGLKVEIDDNLPQNMCNSCVKYLNESLKFRRQSKEAHSRLTGVSDFKNFPADTKAQIRETKLESPSSDRSAQIKIEFADYDSPDIDNKDFLSDTLDSQSDFDTTDDLVLYYNNVKKMEDVTDDSDDSDSDYNLPLINRKADCYVTCTICHLNVLRSNIDNHNATKHPVKTRKKNSLKESYSLKKLFKKTKEDNNIGNFFKGLICSFCDSEFTSKEDLNQHNAVCIFKTKLKRGEGAKNMVECHLCHKKMLKASLKCHIRVKHAGLGPVCEHCGKKVHNTFRLEEHYRAKHGYEKFKCSMCDFETASSYTIRDHERRHRGEKPYVCEACGAKFHAAYLLTQHKQSHRTEKPYKCDICPGSFKTKNSLLMHKGRCHSNLQYKCSLCDRVYTCRRYAVKHMRATHKFEGKIPSLQTLPRKETTVVGESNGEDKL